MPTLTSRRASGAIAAAATFLSVFAAAPKADARIIYACVKQLSGSVRIVAVGTKCKRGEVKIAWVGAAGPPGRTGVTGATGATGAEGAEGLDGAPGARGVSGATGLRGATGAN